MADDLDKQLDAAYQNQVSDSSLDEAYNALAGGPQHGSVLEGMTGAAVHSATLHADNYFTSPEWQQKQKRFQKEHPVLSGIGEAGGFVGGAVGSAFIPGAQGTLPARAGYAATRLAKLADYVLPFGNFARAAAPNAALKTVANESGKGMLKAGAAMRLNDPLAKPATDQTAESPALSNLAQRVTKAGDLPSMAWDYGGGAVGGVVGNKVGGYLGDRLARLGQAATLGNLPKRGATLDVQHEIGRDSTGGGVQGAIERIRNLVYGEDRTLGRHAGGAIPQDAEREMARRFVELTDSGLSDAQAAQRIGRELTRRSVAAQAAIARPSGVGPTQPADAWLVRGGRGFAPDTMTGWGRAAGDAYRARNAIPANLTELTALANGGEAPALQTTLRKLLNLNSEGGARSDMLRGLRERQKGIKPQMEGVLARRLGDGDVGAAIAEHADRAKAANALYTGIYDDARAIPDSAARLQGALQPVIDAALAKAGNKSDALSQALRAEAQKFLNTVEAGGGDLAKPLRSTITKSVKDEAGNVIGKEQTQVPLTKITSTGERVTEGSTPLGAAKISRPAGDLEEIVALRRALKDQVDTAYRGGQKNLGHDLKEFHDNIDKAIRGLGGTDPFGQIVGKWAAANDTRAYAGRLERTYADALGLNLMAKKGGGLMDLERFHARFRNMDEAEKDIARRGIMGQFKAMLETGGDLHDAAKIFSNQRTRDVLVNLFTDTTVKDKAAAKRAAQEIVDELGGHFARGGLATNTFNMNKGSHTASILDSDKESGWLANIAGALWHGNPLRAIGHMGEAAGDALKRRKHADMTELLSAGTHDPARLEEVLKNIARAAAPVNQRLQSMASGGRTYGTVAGAGMSKRRDE